MAKRYHNPDPHAAVTDEVIMAQVQRGCRVVDLGCGGGRLLHRLQTEHDCRVQGVELAFDEFTAASVAGHGQLQSAHKGFCDADVFLLDGEFQRIENAVAQSDTLGVKFFTGCFFHNTKTLTKKGYSAPGS